MALVGGAVVALVLLGLVVHRTGLLFRWPAYVRWRRRRSRRNRGRMRAERPSPEGGTDPTAGI